MRFLSFITAALLPLASLAAKKDATSTFDSWRSKQISNGNPVKLTDQTYTEITKAPRDYSVAVLLTALDTMYGCQLCRDFNSEWNMLARQWAKSDKTGETRTVFGTLDFTDGRGTFQQLMLQTAPVLLLFQPTTGPHAQADSAPLRYDFSTGVSDAEPIHGWIARHMGDRPAPRFVRPLNYFLILVSITTVLGVITFGAIAAPYVLPFLQNRNLWAAISLIMVLLFTSGHMYNHIRKVPYTATDGKGRITYFAGGFQNQFGMETQIIAALYGLLAFASITLALKVPRMADPRAQQFAVFVWVGTLFGTFSFLISIFKVKNGGYPFWLPPFT